ncbi:Ser/Thr protein kinase RdoA involved in Cpx stress response, MazF antagonist [Lentzea xinjiangensis]|uniref:Ser/Thr protein kinase RdoA involved in Cpx stress response, MazF antagonist n=1 Tax=Lentzea xinjiangensis TaxID=402600 RepID=A0A1H9SM13_9PSEU|nr:phosphotransferase [Lentzea xinjiangensis]SER85329.1 Ser/Thr protein kinase RdoA involved in Cpx stress response, MazF antagonist [Lentzea xinjiangensis]
MDLPAWCRDHLGSEPAGVLYERASISSVFGLRLADGREVYVKAREDDDGRAESCLAAQAALAARGFPCPRPITPVTRVGALAVHAEEARPGGAVLPGSSPAVARRCAAVFARLMELLAGVSVAPPVPSPRWARWDHADPGPWPAIGFLDARDQSAVPPFVVEMAERLRARLLATRLPCVLGHADFEAQNLRWRDGEVWAVHDWDSLAWQPEAALVGAASGAFANDSPPGLVPVESSAAFIEAYQEHRGRRFGEEELEVAWAGSTWTAVHNARWEVLHGDAPVSLDAVREQGPRRLRLANA